MTPLDDQPRQPTARSANPLTPAPVSLGDAAVVRELEAYCAALSRGGRPDRRKLLDAYPEIAGDLAECLDGIDLVYQIGPPLEKAELSDTSAAVESPKPHALGTLGDFRIQREIGRGGMGVVYEAEQVSLGRRVALKVLPFAALMDQRQLARFKNEAHAAACLQHQNIVPVYSVGCERGVHYYAMQYIEGRTLAQVIDELRSGQQAASPPHPVTPSVASAETQPDPQAVVSTKGSHRTSEFFRSAAQLGIQAAEALEHAHQMGVVHRDIKPSNLMVDAHGHLWITDFGLAQIVAPSPLGGEGRGEAPSITMTGDVVGTLRYMSPEQAVGKRSQMDHRTDIYSLGVTLYEVLTLQPAFAGDNRQTLTRRLLEEDPPRPRTVNRAIPKDLETIVLKATAKEPQQRYATSQDLADDLRRYLEDQPIRARRPSLVERLGKWSRRHRTLVASAASIAAILLVATTVVALTLAAYEREDARRRLLVQQGINEALAEVARLRGQSPAGAPGDPTALGLAREQLQRALALAETGPAGPELVARVQELSAELGEEHKNRQLLAALDRAWAAEVGTDTVQSSQTPRASIPILREALERYGVAVGKGPPEEAAAAIRARPDSIQRELLAALEEWRAPAPPLIGLRYGTPESGGVIVAIVCDSPAHRDGRFKVGDQLVGVGEGSDGPFVDTRKMTHAEISKLLDGKPGTIVRLRVIPKDQSETRTYELQRDTTRAWLRAILEAADTDPWRRRLREAFDLRDMAQLRAALEKLAGEADVERQPVRTLTRLGTQLGEMGAADQALALLRRVRQRHPGDVLANLRLAEVCFRGVKPPQLEGA